MGNLRIQVLLMKIKNITLVPLFKNYKKTRSCNPAQGSLGYFLVRFQSLQLPSTQSQSPLVLTLLAPKFHASFEVGIQL
jgi:hypothetical protein